MKRIFLTIMTLTSLLFSAWAVAGNDVDPNEGRKGTGTEARSTALMADPENCCRTSQPSKPALLGDNTNARPSVLQLDDKPAEDSTSTGTKSTK